MALEMTWGEFKEAVESQGITDECDLAAIEFNKEDAKLTVLENDEGEKEIYSE
jgi:hypothetical protein